jgi:catechol 2,3-dioxygenase-like lactoylglutathione lyase family enzyme
MDCATHSIRAGCSRTMLAHLSFGVVELGRAADFYDKVLAPLGYARVWSSPQAVGFGERGGPDRLALFARPQASPPGPGFHLALQAPSRVAVDAFHAAALGAGGRDAGAPGPRFHYGASYYAAFVFDPDGHKIEAVHQ